MSEETDAPQGGAEGVEPSAVETHSEATTEQQTGAEDAGQADDAGEEASPKRVPWFQKRIDEVTAQKYEAARQAEYWRGVAEGRNPPPQQQQQPQPEPLPTLEQFNYDEAAYAKALMDHVTKESEKSLDRRLTEREKQAVEQNKTQEALTKLREGGAKHADFAIAVNDLPANEAVRDFVLTEPNAADVLYELGKDAQATARFNSLPLHLQALELGRRAATPAAPKSKTIAPPPPQTVGGLSAGMSKPVEQMTMAEYAEARKAGKI